jgi:hypothetical protein
VVFAGRVLKALIVSLILALSAYGVSKLNLFGFESASDRLADNVYQRITAGDYGLDRKGQKAVSVVYLDETSVEAMKGYGWTRFPPTFDQQWTMLEDLLYSGGAPPAALFVDFVYMGQGGSNEGFDTFIDGLAAATKAAAWQARPGCIDDPLMKIACMVEAGGTPIIFSKPSPAELDIFTDAQRAIDKVAVLAPALVGQQAYPMITRYGFDAAKSARLGVHRFDVSPSLGMYAAYCLRQSDACGVARFADLRRRARLALAGQPEQSPALDQDFDQPLDVVWGSRPDPAYLAMTRAVSGRDAPCRSAAATVWTRLGEQIAGWNGNSAGSGARQECPYNLTLGYDRIVAGQGLQPQDLERLLAGKMVLLGGHFRASNDWVESPVHGQAPGVHYHAMALDNLIEDGANYRRNANAFLDSDLLKSLLIFVLAFCGVLGVMLRNNLLDHASEEGMEPRLKATIYGPLYLALFGVSIALIAVTTWFGVAYFNRSPINWIGLTTCALGFLFYATRQTLPADIYGSLERFALIRLCRNAHMACSTALKFEEDRLLARRRARRAAEAAEDAAEDALETARLAAAAASAEPDKPKEDAVHA